jgi:hypothetical protein
MAQFILLAGQTYPAWTLWRPFQALNVIAPREPIRLEAFSLLIHLEFPLETVRRVPSGGEHRYGRHASQYALVPSSKELQRRSTPH